MKNSPAAPGTTPVTGHSVGDIDSFITMLRAACEDRNMNTRLQELLSLPNDKRKAMLHTWLTDMLIAQAPRSLITAIGCLMDDAVAEKAYEVIFHCQRGQGGPDGHAG